MGRCIRIALALAVLAPALAFDGGAWGAPVTTLSVGQVVTLANPGVALTPPADGRLRGYGYVGEVKGVAFSRHAGGDTTPVQAVPGDELAVFTLDLSVEAGFGSVAPGVSLTVTGPQSTVPLDAHALLTSGSGTYAIAVPTGADPLLQLSASGTTQSFSLRKMARVGVAPEVLYRDPTTPEVYAGTVAPSVMTGTSQNSDASLSETLSATDTYLSWFAPDTTASTLSDPTRAYLVVALNLAGADPASSVVFENFDSVNAWSATLSLSDGTVVNSEDSQALNESASAAFYFAVPANLTAATLSVRLGLVVANVYSDASHTSASRALITFKTPGNLALSFPPPAAYQTLPEPAVASRTSVPTTSAAPGSQSAISGRFAVPVLPVTLAGATGGTLVLFFLVIIPVVRRRRDVAVVVVTPAPGNTVPPQGDTPEREGPPPATPFASDAESSEKVGENPGGIGVLVIGPVEVTGLVGQPSRAAIIELLCFLSLHPGRAYSSAELRSSIWPYPKDEVRPGTLTSYLSRLRKVLPDGALLRNGHTWSLGPEVTTDWARFSSLGATTGPGRAKALAGALALIRGRPFSGIGSRFSWVDEELLSSQIERSVEDAAHELARLRIDEGDAIGARWAVEQGLACLPSSPLLHEDRVAAAAMEGDGARVAATLRDARNALGEDAEGFGSPPTCP